MTYEVRSTCVYSESPEEKQHERDRDEISTIAGEPCNSPMLVPLAGTASRRGEVLLDLIPELAPKVKKPALHLSDIVRQPCTVINRSIVVRHWRHGHWTCSAAPSGQAPTPHCGAPQARGLTAKARTERHHVTAMRVVVGHCPRDRVPNSTPKAVNVRALTGLFGPPDPRCFIPQADEGALETAPTGPGQFPRTGFPTTDRWCDKHRRIRISSV